MENQKKEVWLRKALFLIVSLALFFPMMAQTITVTLIPQHYYNLNFLST